MKRKFELPKDFKVTKNGDEYHLRIIEKNPIWVVLGASLIGAGLTLTYLSMWNLIFCALGALKIFIEFKKQSHVIISKTRFTINNKSFNFESVARIMVDSDNYQGGSLATRGNFKVSFITVETKKEKIKGLGKRMITDYQHALVYILRQFHKGNEAFITKLPNL